MAKSTDYLNRDDLRELWQAIPEQRAAWVRMYLWDKLRQGSAATVRIARPFVAATLLSVGLIVLAYSLGGAFTRGVIDSAEGVQLRLQVEVKE